MYAAEQGRIARILRAAVNTGSARIAQGTPVRFDLQNYYDAGMKGMPVIPMGSSLIGDFAGVTVKSLRYNANFPPTEHTINGVCTQGIVACRFLNHASAVVGSWCRPVVGQVYFTYSAEPTGIRLLTDQTTGTSEHGPGLGDAIPPTIEIQPEALQLTYIWEGPSVEDPNGILAAEATSASAITTVTTGFLNQPGVARMLTVLPGGVTADVPAGDVTIIGTDIEGNVITEALTFAANATAEQITTMAYKTITSVSFPIQDGAGATYDVGWNDNLGITWEYGALRCKYAVLGTTLEGTLPTLNVSAADFTLNNFLLNSAMDTSEVTVRLEP